MDNEPMSLEEALAMRGSGWAGDLDELRQVGPQGASYDELDLRLEVERPRVSPEE